MIKKNLFACQKHYTRTLSARKRRPAPPIPLHQTPIRDVRWQPKGDTPKPEYTCSGLFPDALGSRSAHNLPARGSGAHPGVFCSFFRKKRRLPLRREALFSEKRRFPLRRKALFSEKRRLPLRRKALCPKKRCVPFHRTFPGKTRIPFVPQKNFFRRNRDIPKPKLFSKTGEFPFSAIPDPGI